MTRNWYAFRGKTKRAFCTEERAKRWSRTGYSFNVKRSTALSNLDILRAAVGTSTATWWRYVLSSVAVGYVGEVATRTDTLDPMKIRGMQ